MGRWSVFNLSRRDDTDDEVRLPMLSPQPRKTKGSILLFR